jgi:transcriptional regulator with XRE-family HTH domain
MFLLNSKPMNIMGEGFIMNELILRIGKLVREKRLEKGYTTQELADLLGVSSGLVNNIENAKTDSFNFTLMEKLNNILGISPISILTNDSGEIEKLLHISQDIPGQLSSRINDIIKAYIDAVIKLNFMPDKIEKLTNKVIYEMEFIKDFN